MEQFKWSQTKCTIILEIRSLDISISIYITHVTFIKYLSVSKDRKKQNGKKNTPKQLEMEKNKLVLHTILIMKEKTLCFVKCFLQFKLMEDLFLQVNLHIHSNFNYHQIYLVHVKNNMDHNPIVGVITILEDI